MLDAVLLIGVFGLDLGTMTRALEAVEDEEKLLEIYFLRQINRMTVKTTNFSIFNYIRAGNNRIACFSGCALCSSTALCFRC